MKSDELSEHFILHHKLFICPRIILHHKVLFLSIIRKKRFITSTFSLAILVCQGHILCEELFRGVRHNVRGAPKCNAAAGSPREPEIYGVMDDAFHNVI